ncbi:hypothetical protein H1R20_g13859, partial [Candolleomyces eurysporus]
MKSLNFGKHNSTARLGSNLNGFKTESTNKGSTFSGPLGSLTKLPPELLLRIIDELDDAALCDLGCTCRDFNSLIFQMLFDKLYIAHYLPEGWISCYRAPRYTLRVIRCSLPTRKFNNIYHCFNKGLDHLEEIEDMHAIVTRMDELGELRLFLADPDEWAVREAPGLDETQVPQITSEEWTKAYLGLLTAALAKGCINALLGSGEQFLDYLQSREQTTATYGALTDTVLSLRERVLGSTKAIRYFDGAFRYQSPFNGQPKRSLQVAQYVEPLPLEESTFPQAEVPEAKSGKPPVIKESKKQSRLLKWVEFFSTNKNSHHAETAVSSTARYNSNNSKTPSPGLNRAQAKNPRNDRSRSKTLAPTATRAPPPKPKLQSLTLESNIFLTSPSFLNWTNQVLFWCASTLIHLELECPGASSEIWCKFLSKLKLPSLISFKIAPLLFVEEANVQGSDILGFLTRHPGLQKLYLHGIQVSASLSATPGFGKPILPNLTEVTAHPIWISRLLRNKKQCAKLKEITLLTEYYTNIDDTFEYDAMDRALEEVLPRSHNLDLIGFKFTCDSSDLDFWLQSHVDAGPNSILSSFIDTKHLRIDWRYIVRLINHASRLDLVAQVAGLFPNLDYLELKDLPDVPDNKTDHIPPLIEALRRHSPQIKQVKINEEDPINIADFQSSSSSSDTVLSESLASFTDLPLELTLQILPELDDAALCALGSTCKELNTLIFPYFFEKYKITNPSLGWISCYRVPQHTLRAIRCCLSTKNISNIHYYFNKGIEKVVEEVEEMHAIVRRTDEVTDFRVYLMDPDDWAVRDAPGLSGTQVLPLASEEWTKLYLGLLTTALTKGCKNVLLRGGNPFLKYLQHRELEEQTTAGGVSAGPLNRLLRTRDLDNKTARYFDASPHDAGLPSNRSKRHPQVTQSIDATPVMKGKKSRSRHRLLKWIDFFKKKKSGGPLKAATSSIVPSELTVVDKTTSPTPSLSQPLKSNTLAPTRPPVVQNLILQSDMFFANPSFLDWTNQLLSWCAPTLKHFELQCPETPSETWSKFFSEITLPSLTEFDVSCNLIVGDAHIQGQDILAFLSRHPSIEKLSLHGIQVPSCALPDLGKQILPNLVQVVAHPVYIRWLLRDKKQCPKLKRVFFLTEYYANHSRPFAYDVLDNALEDLLPRSHNLDLIAFRFTNDHSELNSWLESHVDAGLNGSILSSFIDTKRLQINSAYYVKILKSPTRRELVARFLGLFPNLEYLELEEQPGVSYNKGNSYMQTMIEALRVHCPQVKKVKVHSSPMIIVDEFVVEPESSLPTRTRASTPESQFSVDSN